MAEAPTEAEELESPDLMVVEISFGKDRNDEIVVHIGDDPTELAKVCL